MISMQTAVRHMLAGKKALRDKQAVVQYLQLSICYWMAARGFAMPTNTANAIQAP